MPQNDLMKYFKEDLHRRLLSTDFKKQIDGIEMLHKGLGSRNNRTRIECVDLVGFLIDNHGAKIVGQLKSLQLVASLTAERASEIRKAALNTLATGMLFRLYTSYICPYAQRVWIARNYKVVLNFMDNFSALLFLFFFAFIHVTAILDLKFLYFFVRGLQEKIKLVPIDLQNRPDWYKEKVYPPNKVPSLEHNNDIRGESLDLLKYIDSYFEGPALYPDVSTAFDYLESALFKFTDGPFFLGQFSLVDIAYAPFIKRFYPLLLDVKKYDITTGRPMLTSWIKVIQMLSQPWLWKNHNNSDNNHFSLKDPDLCIEILSAHGWDLKQAISSFTSTDNNPSASSITTTTTSVTGHHCWHQSSSSSSLHQSTTPKSSLVL
ncbi:hypothetical protein HYC85_010099 [Camellia sinensis]|uniref:GST N-terminal domain-containing protein n=1 Tax=Camellia sinensis TaxID=4442 RepID=A0A7J7HHW7_CAMSI|nr:hypothetical protein HYC85_010099 [Camellia sinensis]